MVLEDALDEFEDFLDESLYHHRKPEVKAKLQEWHAGSLTDMDMFLYLEEQVEQHGLSPEWLLAPEVMAAGLLDDEHDEGPLLDGHRE